jgi:integrase
MQAGVDLDVLMPYLSRYLGHSSIAQTQYYYHLITQAFPIVRRSDAVFPDVIPEVADHEE